MRDIYIYSTIRAWIDEKPDTVIKGRVKEKTPGYIEIEDENGYTQIIVLAHVFAIVY
jgi:hypothetical protein